jgi:aspartate/methionine/tyrosine aminotransferase
VLSFRPSDAVTRVETTSLRVAQPQSSGDLVSLAMGEPDFDTPAPVVASGVAALESGYTHYSQPGGDPELRAELAAHVSRISGGTIEPEQVIVTHGGSAGLAAAIFAVVNPGDTVVIPDPTYSLYADLVNLAGGTVVSVPLAADLHWDLDALTEALVGAKLFVFCNPGNPTGVVHTAKELEILAQTVAATGTLVLADEAYSDLVYTAQPFVSALQVPGLAERVVYCQTFSKSYAMTGWRIGYLAGPAEIISAAARVHNTVNNAMNSAVQRAALTAIRECADAVRAMSADYRQRRDLMVRELAEVPGLRFDIPEGAFYVFPSYDLDLPSAEVVAALRRHGVAVRPGSEFGARGEGHIRLSYAASVEAISEGVRRLARGLAAL